MGKFSKALEVTGAGYTFVRCPIAKLRANLDKAEYADIEAALDNKEYTAGNISDAIKDAFGVVITDQGIARHRRGQCACRS